MQYEEELKKVEGRRSSVVGSGWLHLNKLGSKWVVGLEEGNEILERKDKIVDAETEGGKDADPGRTVRIGFTHRRR
jgi:hypothetical protein